MIAGGCISAACTLNGTAAVVAGVGVRQDPWRQGACMVCFLVWAFFREHAVTGPAGCTRGSLGCRRSALVRLLHTGCGTVGKQRWENLLHEEGEIPMNG